MKQITIILKINGNEVERDYQAYGVDEIDWDEVVLSMSDTIEKSTEPTKEIPGFEGTMDKLNEF